MTVLGPAAGISVLAAVVVFVLGVVAFFPRWLGAVTGDCLGAVNQVVEVAVLAVCSQHDIAGAVLARLA